jgi:23S rRNA pseudouridine1911/1915/1917 synthase
VNIEVPASLAGERIDRALAALTGLSRTVIADLITNGSVQLNGRVVTTRSVKIEESQTIEADLPDLTDGLPVPEDGIVFDVVHEDADIIVINKPAGLVVHPGNGNETGTLVNGLLSRFADLERNRPGEDDRPGIVHRLDSGTSGLLVVARTQPAYDALVEAMQSRHAIERGYLALVWGDVRPDHGSIDAPIARSDRERTKMAVRAGGKEAITHYDVLAHVDDPSVSLLSARLETGRTHQIRVHFSAIGHAVVGDKRYRGARPALTMDRPFLHAKSLKFDHPITGDPLSFDTPIPEDLQQVMQQLGIELSA